MLNPKEHRLDYGDKLRPPIGFELSYALATSFSVELDTLLTLPVAMCFDNTLEGNLQGEKLALLEAISQLKGRFKVFFQQGNIKIPYQFNRLFTLLESCLVPVLPESAFSSFHPKVWLLRFTDRENSKSVKYRLLVLSRNLTFSRSWDLAVALDGELTSEVQTVSHIDLISFIKDLHKHAKSFDGFSVFNKELGKVKWSLPQGFKELRMLHGNTKKVPINLGEGTESLLVMSPFLHEDALKKLRLASTQESFLFSRAEELNRLGAVKLQEWRCYALNETIVNGEDDLEQGYSQNLHAKLIVAKNGNTFHWHIGSANATVAALGSSDKVLPRNTEFMVRLTSSNEAASLRSLRNELVGEDGKETKIFIEHEFATVEDDLEPIEESLRRQLAHNLICAQWIIKTSTQADNLYLCDVSCLDELDGFNGFIIEVGQLALKGDFKPLQENAVWKNMSLTQISAFLPVRVLRQTDGEMVLQLLIHADLKMENDYREQKILSELVDSEKKLMSYIQMLLSPDEHHDEWFELEKNMDAGSGPGQWQQILDSPILELLLRSASRRPEQLRRIESLMKRLKESQIPIPQSFLQVWQHFSSHMGKRS
ncbi:MAG: phospholipase D family protein [Gammaproteobacteria bacterium]|nr:phospholipase D family protein [Gammaproteobacteria bacterium]